MWFCCCWWWLLAYLFCVFSSVLLVSRSVELLTDFWITNLSCNPEKKSHFVLMYWDRVQVESPLSEMLESRSVFRILECLHICHDISCGWNPSVNIKFIYVSYTPYTEFHGVGLSSCGIMSAVKKFHIWDFQIRDAQSVYPWLIPTIRFTWFELLIFLLGFLCICS